MNGVKSWSPSRLAKYEECPLRFKLDVIEKLCPACFKGKVKGGYDKPAVCDRCKVTILVSAPMARGSRIGQSLERYISWESKPKLDTEIKHPRVVKLAAALRALSQVVSVEHQIYFDKDWRPLPLADKFSPKIWLRVGLDVLRRNGEEPWQVIDWKTGGVDKKGQIRAQDKYDDQLGVYQTAVLASNPMVGSVTASLVFIDAAPAVDPFIDRAPMLRGKLPVMKEKWEAKVQPMFRDEIFAPRAGYYCKWCPFRKEQGGPCPY